MNPEDHDLPKSVRKALLKRPRRLREQPQLRRMVREARLSKEDLVLPLFVVPGRKVREEVASMPGVFRESVDELAESCRKAEALGIPAVILFGVPESKDATGSSSWKKGGIVQRALEAITVAAPGLLRIADLCFCEYTDHGHCGVLRGDGSLDNDATLVNLSRQAVSLGEAGAQVIAPSGMLDGMVAAIRAALDGSGMTGTPILSYAAKYASAFYGPFRDAAGSAPSFGDRRGYQMDPANGDEALREIALDLEQGADFVMVKPAMPYLDVIRRARERFDVPIAAYQVSGEYAMIKAAAKAGVLDEDRIVDETLLCIKRAGADIILTYFAREVAARLER
jgi:porphobilinogen synthase